LGTIFFYASDKRDLLFLIYNDEQDLLTQKAFGRSSQGNLLSRLIAAFATYYEFFAQEPVFMRYVLRELTFYSSGREAERFQSGRAAIVSGIEALVAEAKRHGQIGSREPSLLIAEVIFGIYQAELRRWLMNRRPDPKVGLRRLRAALQLLVKGLMPAAARR
jgi:AcrR family transcriptional regulator